jgi:cytochrome oxidase Cu insertion factor (SCO1/SenC/PrrC family)
MKKISETVSILENKYPDLIQPIFISVDPQRDSLEVIDLYLKGKINLINNRLSSKIYRIDRHP